MARPLLGEFFCAPLVIPHTIPCTKVEITSLSSFEDMFDRMPKSVGSRDLGHAHI